MRKNDPFGVARTVFRICTFVCSPDRVSLAEAEYTAKIVGGWPDTVGNEKESISLSPVGTFFPGCSQEGPTPLFMVSRAQFASQQAMVTELR